MAQSEQVTQQILLSKKNFDILLFACHCALIRGQTIHYTMDETISIAEMVFSSGDGVDFKKHKEIIEEYVRCCGVCQMERDVVRTMKEKLACNNDPTEKNRNEYNPTRHLLRQCEDAKIYFLACKPYTAFARGFLPKNYAFESKVDRVAAWRFPPIDYEDEFFPLSTNITTYQSRVDPCIPSTVLADGSRLYMHKQAKTYYYRQLDRKWTLAANFQKLLRDLYDERCHEELVETMRWTKPSDAISRERTIVLRFDVNGRVVNADVKTDEEQPFTLPFRRAWVKKENVACKLIKQVHKLVGTSTILTQKGLSKYKEGALLDDIYNLKHLHTFLNYLKFCTNYPLVPPSLRVVPKHPMQYCHLQKLCDTDIKGGTVPGKVFILYDMFSSYIMDVFVVAVSVLHSETCLAHNVYRSLRKYATITQNNALVLVLPAVFGRPIREYLNLFMQSPPFVQEYDFDIPADETPNAGMKMYIEMCATECLNWETYFEIFSNIANETKYRKCGVSVSPAVIFESNVCLVGLKD